MKIGVRIGKQDKPLDEGNDAWDESSAEKQVDYSPACPAKIKLVHANATEQERQNRCGDKTLVGNARKACLLRRAAFGATERIGMDLNTATIAVHTLRNRAGSVSCWGKSNRRAC